jgi:uncharacterized protein (DUF305 family)
VRTTAIAAVVGAAAITVLGLTGCASHEEAAAAGAGESVSYDEPPTAAPTTAVADHSTADVSYVTTAVLLHQQIVDAANLATTSATSSRITTFAAKLVQDTQPPVTTLTGLLTQWGQPAPSGKVQGGLSDADVTALKAAKGSAFNTLWVHDVTADLTSALDASTAEATNGTDPTVKQAAGSWATALQSELSTVKSLG